MKIKIFAIIFTIIILMTSLPACTDRIPDVTDDIKVHDAKDTDPPETQPQEDLDHPLDGKLVINEICSSNKTVSADKKGEFPDWLEIMNVSKENIQLEGIGLSKSEDEPYALTMPRMTLAPGTFRF